MGNNRRWAGNLTVVLREFTIFRVLLNWVIKKGYGLHQIIAMVPGPSGRFLLVNLGGPESGRRMQLIFYVCTPN